MEIRGEGGVGLSGVGVGVGGRDEKGEKWVGMRGGVGFY